jgi:hypothetical protein
MANYFNQTVQYGWIFYTEISMELLCWCYMKYRTLHQGGRGRLEVSICV